MNWFIVVSVAALAIAWFILYKTRFECGSCPGELQAADSVGINVCIKCVGPAC